MTTKILLQTATGREYPYRRGDGAPLVGLIPGFVVLDVIVELQPEPGEGFEIRRADPVDDLVAGTRTYGWIVEALPAAPPDVRSFYRALIASNFYLAKLAPLLFSPEPTWAGEPFSVVTAAATNLLIGVTEPPGNRQPEPSLQSSLWGFMAVASAVGAIEPQDIAEVEGLMAAHGLTGVYSLVPPSP